MGRDITRCSEAELRELKAELDRQYAGYVAQNLKLDMSRGKPSGTQLNLTNGILDKLDSYVTGDGVDARNYGGLEGIPEARRLFSELLGIGYDKIIIGGNSSLNLMYDAMMRLYVFGTGDHLPWRRPGRIWTWWKSLSPKTTRSRASGAYRFTPIRRESVTAMKRSIVWPG